MWDFDKSNQDDGIPDFLRRDANNVAPYMRRATQPSLSTSEDNNDFGLMPWELK